MAFKTLKCILIKTKLYMQIWPYKFCHTTYHDPLMFWQVKYQVNKTLLTDVTNGV